LGSGEAWLGGGMEKVEDRERGKEKLVDTLIDDGEEDVIEVEGEEGESEPEPEQHSLETEANSGLEANA
jgi:hypothetical protein